MSEKDSHLSFDKLCFIKEKIKPFLHETLADSFRKVGNENFMSDWLAFLIDPKLSKSTEILERFLQMIEIEKMPDICNVEASREKGFGKCGRVDIVIKADRMLLLIENKLYSGLGKDQDKRYIEALENVLESKDKKAMRSIKN